VSSRTSTKNRQPLSLAPDFTPKSLYGVQGWYRADLGITLSGSYVVGWADQSGVGDSNRNLGTAEAPTLTGSNPNYGGQATVGFQANNVQLMTSSAWSSPLPFPCTAFWVGQSDQSTIEGFFDDIVHGETMCAYVDSTLGGRLIVQYGGSMITTTFVPQAPMVGTCTFNSPLSSVYVNGGPPLNVGPITQLNTFTGLTVGSTQGGGHALNGQVAELAFWNRILAAWELEMLALYAKQRYLLAKVA
jgi:hypothetical protein